MDRPVPGLEFRFFQEALPQQQRVPARVLADALEHAQRAVHLLALSAVGREIRQRVRVPADLAEQFVLECQLPQAGSYVQPVQLRTSDNLLDGVMGADVLHRFQEIAAGLSDGDWASVRALLPDGAARSRILDEFVHMLPDPETGWVVDLRNGSDRTARFDPGSVRVIRDYQRTSRRPEGSLASPVTLTGEVVRIDFAEHKLTIRTHPSQHRLVCEYAAELEDVLVEKRRGLIRVTGLVERDSRDLPIRLTDVFDIQELDLSPIAVDVITGPQRHLRFRAGAIHFPIELDDEGELLVIHDRVLDVHVFGHTRAEVASELMAHIELMWIEYAEADPARLTAGAAALGATFRERLERIDHDT